MTIAGCGHEIDLWFTSPHIICKPCFEAQGFVYNRNTYRGCDGERLVARSELPSTAAEMDRRRKRLARAAA